MYLHEIISLILIILKLIYGKENTYQCLPHHTCKITVNKDMNANWETFDIIWQMSSPVGRRLTTASSMAWLWMRAYATAWGPRDLPGPSWTWMRCRWESLSAGLEGQWTESLEGCKAHVLDCWGCVLVSHFVSSVMFLAVSDVLSSTGWVDDWLSGSWWFVCVSVCLSD